MIPQREKSKSKISSIYSWRFEFRSLWRRLMLLKNACICLGAEPSTFPHSVCPLEELTEWGDLPYKLSHRWRSPLRESHWVLGEGWIEEAPPTMVQPSWGPRSLKYMVAVVPTGRFCSTSSSLRALASGKTIRENHHCTKVHDLRLE